MPSMFRGISRCFFIEFKSRAIWDCSAGPYEEVGGWVPAPPPGFFRGFLAVSQVFFSGFGVGESFLKGCFTVDRLLNQGKPTRRDA